MEATKRCPFCAEEILALAVKCKHCGSAIPSMASANAFITPASIVKGQLRMRRSFATVGGILALLLAAGLTYNWSRTGSMTGNGFSEADIPRIEQDITSELSKRRGVKVEEVKMMKESTRRLTGFAKVRVPLLGEVNRNCTATMGEDGQSMWECR